MALPTPFETKRKKAPIGAPGRIQHLNVAEGTRLGPDPLHPLSYCNHLYVAEFEGHPVRADLAANLLDCLALTNTSRVAIAKIVLQGYIASKI